MKPRLTLRRETALVVVRAAAFVPAARRRAFLKGFVVGLKGLSQPDADQVANAITTQLRLAGVLPIGRKRKAGPSPFKRAA